jgi:hypothetical protein
MIPRINDIRTYNLKQIICRNINNLKINIKKTNCERFNQANVFYLSINKKELQE